MCSPIFLDIETTGTDPDTHQTIEVAVMDDRRNTYAEFGIKHDRLVYEPSRLLRLGHGYRGDLTRLSVEEAALELSSLLYDERRTICGKNVFFDLAFLRKICPFIRHRYSIIDVGNLWMRRTDKEVPSLKDCCERAGMKYESTLAHTAWYDCGITKELYYRWQNADGVRTTDQSGVGTVGG